MKTPLLLLVQFISCFILYSCQNSSKNTNSTSNNNTNLNVATEKGKINWIDIKELEAKNSEQAKKVIIDLYTNWCGWCKRMDKDAFEHKQVADFINSNFYAVKFNAETSDEITFKGAKYTAPAGGNGMRRPTHNLAKEIILGKNVSGSFGYPTVAFLDEKLDRINAFMGYRNAAQMDVLTNYIQQNLYKTVPLEQFEQNFKSMIPTTQPNK